VNCPGCGQQVNGASLIVVPSPEYAPKWRLAFCNLDCWELWLEPPEVKVISFGTGLNQYRLDRIAPSRAHLTEEEMHRLWENQPHRSQGEALEHPCSIEGCDEPAPPQGTYCPMHRSERAREYQRNLRERASELGITVRVLRRQMALERQ
jgi:hypothetical protein